MAAVVGRGSRRPRGARGVRVVRRASAPAVAAAGGSGGGVPLRGIECTRDELIALCVAWREASAALRGRFSRSVAAAVARADAMLREWPAQRVGFPLAGSLDGWVEVCAFGVALAWERQRWERRACFVAWIARLIPVVSAWDRAGAV